MAAFRAAALLFAAIAGLAAGVQPKELQDWFASADGLAMTPSDAQALASQSWQTLTLCGVAVKDLQALRKVMGSSGLDLDISRLRQEILLLAEQHVNPDKLGTFYTALTSSYTLYGGLALSKSEGQQRALNLIKARGDPDQLYALYKVMYGYSGLGIDQQTAQQLSIQLTFAGADADTFKSTYQANKDRGASPAVCAQNASTAAINANLEGLVRRYSRDAVPYTGPEFQQFFGATWLTEWLNAPQEMRISDDKRAYTAAQFKRHIGSSWSAKYRTATEAIQERQADDGKTYSIDQYKQYYGVNNWQPLWARSPELPCSTCSPYVAQASREQITV